MDGRGPRHSPSPIGTTGYNTTNTKKKRKEKTRNNKTVKKARWSTNKKGKIRGWHKNQQLDPAPSPVRMGLRLTVISEIPSSIILHVRMRARVRDNRSVTDRPVLCLRGEGGSTLDAGLRKGINREGVPGLRRRRRTWGARNVIAVVWGIRGSLSPRDPMPRNSDQVSRIDGPRTSDRRPRYHGSAAPVSPIGGPGVADRWPRYHRSAAPGSRIGGPGIADRRHRVVDRRLQVRIHGYPLA